MIDDAKNQSVSRKGRTTTTFVGNIVGKKYYSPFHCAAQPRHVTGVFEIVFRHAAHEYIGSYNHLEPQGARRPLPEVSYFFCSLKAPSSSALFSGAAGERQSLQANLATYVIVQRKCLRLNFIFCRHQQKHDTIIGPYHAISHGIPHVHHAANQGTGTLADVTS